MSLRGEGRTTEMFPTWDHVGSMLLRNKERRGCRDQDCRTADALTRSSLEDARLGPWTGSQLRHRSRSP